MQGHQGCFMSGLPTPTPLTPLPCWDGKTRWGSSLSAYSPSQLTGSPPPVYFPQSPLDPSEQGKEEKAIRTEWPLSTREDSQTHSVVELRY